MVVAPPTWAVATTIATVSNLPGGAATPANDTPGQGTITITGATLSLHASTQRFIGVNFPNALPASFIDATTNDTLSITLKLRRTSGLRP